VTQRCQQAGSSILQSAFTTSAEASVIRFERRRHCQPSQVEYIVSQRCIHCQRYRSKQYALNRERQPRLTRCSFINLDVAPVRQEWSVAVPKTVARTDARVPKRVDASLEQDVTASAPPAVRSPGALAGRLARASSRCFRHCRAGCLQRNRSQ
jgi:hypothetical protein